MDEAYGLLAGQKQPEPLELGTAPSEPGRMLGLPKIAINDLAGLLEHLAEEPNDRIDLYHLADDLRVDSDNLLLLTEAAELLGFATVSQGDIALTSLGETFADASIQARKEIFVTRIRRLPFIKMKCFI